MRRWMTGAVAAALFWGPAAYAQDRVQPDARVVRSVVVRSEASTGSAPIDALAPGETATLTGEVPNWYRVTLPDGR